LIEGGAGRSTTGPLPLFEVSMHEQFQVASRWVSSATVFIFEVVIAAYLICAAVKFFYLRLVS
jgi:hypothetical protein